MNPDSREPLYWGEFVGGPGDGGKFPLGVPVPRDLAIPELPDATLMPPVCPPVRAHAAHKVHRYICGGAKTTDGNWRYDYQGWAAQ